MTTQTLTFQDAVARLQQYWADQGCVVWLPHNVEVGAGTMNPATFLHVLGPEPWNVVYVEPSIRPDDARYGENPNRMGRHNQLQVVLKPDPGDPQQLYLASLAAVGVDLRRHDVRFVEDNWESPALGAWGLGWEVWLDGLEITQFTYFQQAGSLDLEPVSVEITYGIDRILMALQDVDHFKDLRWNEHVTFGDVMLAYEVQTSRYYFEEADVARLSAIYDLTESEAERCLDLGLARPAHDYVLRCSHLFNILDARGAVGVTERARFFKRMRSLARRVSESYLAERSELGYPLLKRTEADAWIAGKGLALLEERSSPPSPRAAPDEPAHFLLEIGVEEMPSAEIDSAMAQLGERVPEMLDDLRLAYDGLDVLGTPRRLAVLVSGLVPRQADVEEPVVGPPERAAFDADGNPTGAARGFAKSAGVAVEELTIVEKGGDRRVAAVKRLVGRPSGEVLVDALADLIDGLSFGRSMRWNESGQTFSRPVRWLVAMHGRSIVPVRFAGLTAGEVTRGSRPRGCPHLPLASAEDYRKLMRTHGIEVSRDRRRQDVERQVRALAAVAGGEVPDDPGLMDEVTNLVETPYALMGTFDARFLELPPAVLVTVLRKHQRWFPVESSPGVLMPHFVAVANGDGIDPDAVRHGNEAVVRARFADAAYFWKADQARSLHEFASDLAKLSFQADLGSMLDKTSRLAVLAPRLAARIGLDEDDQAFSRRAAELAKCDLATSMVVDFTSLQGVMGAEYARRSGEPEQVAIAIGEQYLPSGTGDDVPATGPGTALALADRLDSLVGLFAAGLRPSGTQDPYALRRAAVGVTAILMKHEIDMDLGPIVAEVADGLPLPADDKVQSDVLDFVARRLEVSLREQGHAADAVSAALAVQSTNPHAAARAVRGIESRVRGDGWSRTLTAYARCARIVRGRDDVPGDVDASLLAEPAEVQLHTSLVSATVDLDRHDPVAVLDTIERLAPAIDHFFDNVMVMADDDKIRRNRLALVGSIAGLTSRLFDLSKMEGF